MAIDADPTIGDRQVEVLLAGSDPEYLERVASQVTGDGIEAHTVATTDPEAAVTRLDEGGVDCLIATYNPSANEGLPILDYLRDESVEVPVILLPSGPTTVVVSENLVVDVASVFTRDEAIQEGAGIEPTDVVTAVEQRRANEAARRRRGLEEGLEEVARELGEADDPRDVDRELVEGMAGTDEVDGAWMAEVAGDDVAVGTGVAEDTNASPPDEGPPSDAVKRALAVEQPQVTSHGDANYAAVPVTPESDDSRVLTMASESRYAFGDEETRVLRDVGDTASRAIDDVTPEELGIGAVQDREAFDTVLEQLSVPVVAYGDAGWVAGANEAFASLVESTRDALVDQPVWDVLPSPNIDTFEDYWASFSAGETRTQVVDFEATEVPRQLVTTRVDVDDEPYNVTLAVETLGEGADSWFADVLAYEFRHWLDIAQEAAGGEDEDSEVVDAVVDQMQDAIASEVEAAKAGAHAGTGDIELREPAPGEPGEVGAGGAEAVDGGTKAAGTDAAGTAGGDAGAGPADAEIGSEGEGIEAELDAGDGATGVEPADPGELSLEEGELADAARTGRRTDAASGFGKKPQPVSGVARDAWMTVVGEFGEYEIRGDRQVLADETLLHRLFAHLFRTLFSYGKASGVDVGVTDDGFFVADDGSGVPHHERNYAEGETMLDAESGAGIQVARRLARRHGWSLDMEETDDGGTRFVVSGATIRS